MADTIIASPSTRAYAGRQGVDLEALARETGRTTLGREDVDAKAAGKPLAGPQAGAAAPAAPATSTAAAYWDVDHSAYGPIATEPLGRLGEAAAANLGAANALIPQVTHHDEAEIEALESLRASLKDEAARRGVRLTALAFQVKALARALEAHPRFNASLSPDGKTLILKQFVHIGIAVDTPAGLLVPVIRNADRKGLWQLAAEIADLAGKAKARKLGPDAMGGASSTITNLGGIGGVGFTPIVNPPEVAILGLTRAFVKPVWDGSAFQPVRMVPLDLSYDHRVINGADAARFTRYLADLLADPRRLLI